MYAAALGLMSNTTSSEDIEFGDAIAPTSSLLLLRADDVLLLMLLLALLLLLLPI